MGLAHKLARAFIKSHYIPFMRVLSYVYTWFQNTHCKVNQRGSNDNGTPVVVDAADVVKLMQEEEEEDKAAA